jgi:hypothetical protein
LVFQIHTVFLWGNYLWQASRTLVGRGPGWSEDWATFGKIRQVEEKRLRDPDDVFIHAQERKQEIARERGKTKRKK